ncbi:DNA primases [Striga asiatica]|uniref:DNA-directed primase/polymerase protein n=1 Tax=Striga asiatica TaxID=4170 RepID=A0A5A7R127_STRAF|nr:DNA primases [Striga asiatica]
MDDVDRLFQCFKCGISPPQSAVREKGQGKRKMKMKQEHSPPLQASAVSENKKGNPKYVRKFSPVVFYGSPNGVPPKRPSSLLRLLHEIRVDLAEHNESREEIWTTFPRQDEAMKFAKQHMNSRIFSYQDHMSGQRRFLVSTYKEFWRRYKDMKSKFRHHYEVIQEGLPCHLYFDLEFNKRENIGRDGDEMVDLLINVIFDLLLEMYSIQGTEDFVVELDSSTEEKFSRHLIIRIPRTAFKDNSHVGAFVAEVSYANACNGYPVHLQYLYYISDIFFTIMMSSTYKFYLHSLSCGQICSRIYICKVKDENYEKLFVSKSPNSADSQCQLFIDTAVYSRNRCFRLAFSSKAGKSSFLLPSGRFKCKDMGEEEIFMTSLICKVDADSEKLLICKMDLECVKALHFETEITGNISKHSNGPEKFYSNAFTSEAPSTYMSGKSPYPALDAFVEAIASKGDVPGESIWYWFSEFELMVYSMSRNRYCERIGREHKSNHVIYVVDLRRAVYYQKCHDPDCRGYRSPIRAVPDDVIPDPHFLFKFSGNIENEGQIGPAVEENGTDSCSKDEWWDEAVKVAEQVEQIQKALDMAQMEEKSEEDENWWMAVESAASEIESTYLQSEKLAIRDNMLLV